MAFTVVYDACVLYPGALRDLLMRVAITGIVRAHWTHAILDECFQSLLANRPDLKREQLEITRRRMIEAVPDCLIEGFEPLVGGLTLPDPHDRHVLAAAIRAGAQTIVTFNLDDFPNDDLAPFSIEALHPDEFILGLIDIRPGVVVEAIAQQALALKNPSCTISELLTRLERHQLVRSAARIRDMT